MRRAVAVLLLAVSVVMPRVVFAAQRPLGETIRAAVEAVRPAVVDIEVKGRKRADRPQIPGWPFGDRWPKQPREWRFEFRWPPREGDQPRVLPRILPFGDAPFQQFRRRPTRGSGLVIEAKGDRGLVVAPHAVVEGAEAAFVTLPDGRQLAAKILGSDATSGLACLEVRGPKLPAVKLAKADALRVGDWVLAVGGPATANAVTIGIVSTKRRPGEGPLAGTEVYAADINLPEGMAGGPVVNLKGEVVGIAAPPPRRGTLAAIVPVDSVRSIIHALAREGRVRRGWLGIMLQPLDPEAMRQLGIENGIQVARVLEGQPAERAGIQAGDVILEFRGRKVTDVDSFRAMVSGTRPGTKVPVKVLRGGKQMVIEVLLGEQGGEGVAKAEPGALPEGGAKLDIGLSVQELTPELADQFGFQGEKGLLVTDVEADGPAAKARPAPIARGELIKEAGRKAVATVADLKAAIAQARKTDDKTLLLLVRGKEGTRYTVLDLKR